MMQSKIGNKSKGRQSARHKAKRERALIKRRSKVNAKKINRLKRITKGNSFRHSSKGATPSDDRRAKRRVGIKRKTS